MTSDNPDGRTCCSMQGNFMLYKFRQMRNIVFSPEHPDHHNIGVSRDVSSICSRTCPSNPRNRHRCQFAHCQFQRLSRRAPGLFLILNTVYAHFSESFSLLSSKSPTTTLKLREQQQTGRRKHDWPGSDNTDCFTFYISCAIDPWYATHAGSNNAASSNDKSAVLKSPYSQYAHIFAWPPCASAPMHLRLEHRFEVLRGNHSTGRKSCAEGLNPLSNK